MAYSMCMATVPPHKEQQEMATQFEQLTAIQEAMKVSPFYLFMSESASKPLVKKGLVEVNKEIGNEDYQYATRLTADGVAFLNSNSEPIATPAKVAAMSTFIVKSAPIPVTKRKGGAGRPSKYPFDQLEVGQYFFVPDTKEQPEPAKTLGSVVSSANKRYATISEETKTNRKGETVPKLIYNRKFIIRPFHETDEEGNIVNGAGIWREK